LPERRERTIVFWLVLWSGVLTVGALCLVALVNSLRFRRRVAREARELWESSAEPLPVELHRASPLPPPVQRYASRAVLGRTHAVQRILLVHGGTFRPRLDGHWLSIRGRQYFSSDPPGFVWWGRCRLAPGVWIEARDRSVGGAGHMLVKAESTVTLADRSGPELDQGALLRLLAEMVWFPTAFLDRRYVTWLPIDEHRASATLSVGGLEASATFTFGSEGLPELLSAERYREVGGRSVLTPWSGEYADYREVGGLLVPYRVEVGWGIDGRSLPYARWIIDRIEYDV
jgi:uncharacterized protein DUF6544